MLLSPPGTLKPACSRPPPEESPPAEPDPPPELPLEGPPAPLSAPPCSAPPPARLGPFAPDPSRCWELFCVASRLTVDSVVPSPPPQAARTTAQAGAASRIGRLSRRPKVVGLSAGFLATRVA